MAKISGLSSIFRVGNAKACQRPKSKRPCATGSIPCFMTSHVQCDLDFNLV